MRLSVRQPERSAKFHINRRDRIDGFLFTRGNRANVIIEMSNFNSTVVVAHARDEIGDQCSGIRSPVSIVTAVQRPRRTENSDVDSGYTATAELYLLLSVLMIGPVAKQPRISVQSITVTLQHFFVMR